MDHSVMSLIFDFRFDTFKAFNSRISKLRKYGGKVEGSAAGRC